MLELKKQGSTFQVPDSMVVKDGDPDTIYTIRVLTLDDVYRLTKKCVEANTTKEYNPSTAKMDTKVNEQQARVDLTLAMLDHIIVDWTGIVSDGEPLPCTLEFKRQLPGERQDRLLTLAKENAQVKAAVREQTFRGPEDVRDVREVSATDRELLSSRG